MRYLLTSLSILLIAIAGCAVTPKVVQKPTTQTDFKQFKSVHYNVHALPNTEYGSSEEDKTYARQTIDLTDSLLSKKLTSMGYTIVNEEDAADLSLDVAVTVCKPGSAATRFWIGFGAGKALYEFDASFTDRQGQSVGKFHGGRAYTGMEFGKAFSSRDEISTFAATRAVEQIQDFITNGGTFPEEQRSGN